ncbi:MAG: ferrous iron transport protein A [Planctomycetes bacterium]|nr:ferrous iron transport protein A [Planctomycetota bacterium]
MNRAANNLQPLSMIAPGRRARIVTVNAGRGLQARLAEMGLVPGTVIDVIQNSGSGAFVVAVKQGRLMLGRGMAHKIMVG